MPQIYHRNGRIVHATAADTYNFAVEAGWPCSVLAGNSVAVDEDALGNLVNIVTTADQEVPADELDAFLEWAEDQTT